MGSQATPVQRLSRSYSWSQTTGSTFPEQNHKTVIARNCPHCIVNKIQNIGECIFHLSVLLEGSQRHFVLESHSHSLNRPYERAPQSKYKKFMSHLKFKGNTSLQGQYSPSLHSWLCQTFFRSPVQSTNQKQHSPAQQLIIYFELLVDISSLTLVTNLLMRLFINNTDEFKKGFFWISWS